MNQRTRTTSWLHSLFRAPQPRRCGSPVSLIEHFEERVLLTQYSVFSNADSGPNTLRQAIIDANAHAGADTIVFSLESDSLKIQPLTVLPMITDAVTIDGTSQTGYADAPLVVLDGALVTEPDLDLYIGLQLATGNSTIKGLAFQNYREAILIGGDETTGVTANHVEDCYIGFNAELAIIGIINNNGIRIANGATNNVIGGSDGQGNVIAGTNQAIYLDGPGVDGNIIAGNAIGTSADRTMAVSNGTGILITGGANNTIGGLVEGASNLISANFMFGILISEVTATGNVIQGNLIGTNASGTGPLASFGNEVGIYLFGGPHDNLIGGTSPGARNIIAGVRGDGIILSGIYTANNSIQGNYLGVDITGSNKIENFGNDIKFANGAHDNLVGGTTPGTGNVISGAFRHGIFLSERATRNAIEGNLIGTNASGTAGIANGNDGIRIDQAWENQIGGEITGAGNVIAFNTSRGVNVTGDTALDNTIVGNSIYSNGAFEIDLQGDLATNNDAHDSDDGPNGLQNFPVLTSATFNGGNLTIQGTLSSTPDSLISVAFYASPSDDQNGFAQAQSFLGVHSVQVAPSGVSDFVAILPVSVPSGYVISAVATGIGSGSSEFSHSVEVTHSITHNPILFVTSSASNYHVGQPSISIAADALVTDADSPDFQGGQLVASMQPKGKGKELLGIRNEGTSEGQISAVDGALQYGGAVIGTYSGGKGKKPLIVRFTAGADIPAVQAIVRSLTFQNTSKKTTAPRRPASIKPVSIQLTDPDGHQSNTVTALIHYV